MKQKPLVKYLFEDAPPPPDPTPQTARPTDLTSSILPPNISLDQKVDAYILQYEKESSPTAYKGVTARNKPMPALPESKTTKFVKLLFEADPGAGGDAGGGAPSGGGLDMGGAPDTGGGLDLPDPSLGGDSGGDNKDKPPAVPVPKLNLNVFANKAARLVMNFDTLVDPKTVILNRIIAFVAKNYSQNMANELQLALELNYGLSNKGTQDFESMIAPIASGAGVGDLSSAVGSGGSQ